MWWRRKKAPSGEMAERFGGATRARILEGGVADGKALGERVALELGKPDVGELLRRLEVSEPETPFHCMCLGDWGIELYQGDRRLVTIGLHHGQSLRVDSWHSDAMLRDGEGLLRFLAKRGLSAPLEAWLEDRARDERGARFRARWLEAAPASLTDMLPELESGANTAVRREALERLGGPPRAARALLAWLAAGSGPWNGFPSYESVAIELLQLAGAQEVADVANATTNADQLLAAARFFSRWGAPPKERRLIAASLADRLREVTDARGDDDARARLASALRPLEPPAGGPVVGQTENQRDFDFVVPVMLATGSNAVVALDGPELVLFEGGTRTVVRDGVGSVGALVASAQTLYLSLLESEEIASLDLESGAFRIVASDAPKVRSMAAVDGRLVWIEDRPHSITVRERGRAQPWAEEGGTALCVALAGPEPLWARTASDVFSAGDLRTMEVVRARDSGKLVRVARFKGDESYVWPTFVADESRIVCRLGRDVRVQDRDSGREHMLGFSRSVVSIALDGDELFALALDSERTNAELLRVDLNDGTSKGLLSYGRAKYHRECLSVTSTHAAWGVGGLAFCVPRNRG